jgi:hypothetical protein
MLMSSRDVRRVLLACSAALVALLAVALGPVAAAHATYSSTVLADTPLGYWPLDGTTTASAADATGHGYTLTGTQTSNLTAGVPGPIPGQTAVAFNGGAFTRAYFNYTNNFAIELWARSNRVNEREAMVSNGWVGSSDNCWHGALAAGDGANAAGYDANTCNDGGWAGSVPTFTSSSDWHHLVVQRSAGVTTFYVDGDPRPGTDSHAITLGGGSFRIGSFQDNHLSDTNGVASGTYASFGLFKGAISNVAYYNHTLTDAQIAEHYNIVVGAPTNATLPTISPSTEIGTGVTLAASTGQWVGAGLAYSYQWLRCDGSGASCASISGATSASYTLQIADAEHTVRVRVTGTNTKGTDVATSAATDPVAVQVPHVQSLYARTVLSDTPLGYWPLNGASTASAADATGHGYTLTGTGSLTAGATGPVIGSQGVTFSGGYFTRGYFNYTNNFAMELWARSTRDGAREAMVSNGWVGGDNCWHGVLAGTQVASVFGYDANTCSQGGSAGNYSTFAGTTDWHHIVVQRVSGVTSLWVDGVQRGGTDSQTITLNGGSFRIGAWHDSHKSDTVGLSSDSFGVFKGTVSNVAYYSHTLTSTQIAAHFTTGRGVPTDTTYPTVSPGGDLYDGDTLTAASGTWAGQGPITYAYQWQACVAPGSCAPIAGATATTYLVTPAEIGKTVRVVVTATNALGSETMPSAATATVVDQNPVDTALPAISGGAIDGGTLSATLGTWTGRPTISHVRQWQRCDAAGASCADVAGATGPDLVLAAGDVGSTFRVVVTATNALTSTSATSAASAVVAPAPPVADAPPAVSGDATDFATLTSTVGSWSGTPTITYARQWRRCNASGGACTSIAGATGATYTLTSADVSGTVRVAVTATNAAGPVTATSAATGVVAGVAPEDTALPEISGDAVDFETLSSSDGAWSGTTPISHAYQWRRCDASGDGCADISGATGAGYTLTSADVGGTVRVVVTATNVAGADSATSAASDVVAGVAPANTDAPAITGDPTDGETLSASLGAWSGTTPITHARQWQRCDASGDDCADISGATASTYTLTSADVGGTVRVTVTATNVAGSTPATSAASDVVAPAPPVAEASPTVSGDATDFATLTSTVGTWSGTPTITYTRQWLRCDASGDDCAGISGATSATYTLTSADVGSTIRATVTATNAAGPDSATSDATGVVDAVAPDSTTAPEISGNAVDFETLSSSDGAWSGTTPITHAYQWRRCDSDGDDCADISGATGASYTLTSDDVGSTIRVSVTATNVAGADSATSAASDVVAGVAPANTDTPSVTGDATEGETLSASLGDWSGTTPISHTRRWRRCDSGGDNCVDIDDATAASYTLTSDDVGATIRVVVTATNSAGSDSATSDATDVIAPV